MVVPPGWLARTTTSPAPVRISIFWLIRAGPRNTTYSTGSPESAVAVNAIGASP